MRNRQAPHIDFADLVGLMDKRLPSNIDMVMERHGKFLIGEWKRPDEKIYWSTNSSEAICQATKLYCANCDWRYK